MAKKYDAQENMDRFYNEQYLLRKERDLERLQFGGYGKTADSSDCSQQIGNSPNIRTKLLKSGNIEP